MALVIDHLTDFQQTVLRNTPALRLKSQVFNDLSDDPHDWGYAQTAIEKVGLDLFTPEYQAIHFIFNRSEWTPSRFGDGSFPAWYGSLEIETTFAETIFHWKNTLLSDMGLVSPSDYKEPIYALRSVFSIECQALLVDLRGKEKECPALVQKSLKQYSETQKIGRQLRLASAGLMTPSARHAGGTNIVIFNQAVLNDPRLKGEFLYELSPRNPEVKVTNTRTKKALLFR